MATTNPKFIYYGTAQLNDVIILDYKKSFTGGLFITVAKADNKQHFIGVQINATGKNDIASMQRKMTHINIAADIFKNPTTERVLYIVEDATTGFEIL